MKIQAFQTFAGQKGFLTSGKMAFGILDQYPVSLEYTNGNGKRSVLILQFMLKAPLDKMQQKELRESLAKTAGLYVNQGTIRFQITARAVSYTHLSPTDPCPACTGAAHDTLPS